MAAQAAWRTAVGSALQQAAFRKELADAQVGDLGLCQVVEQHVGALDVHVHQLRQRQLVMRQI